MQVAVIIHNKPESLSAKLAKKVKTVQDLAPTNNKYISMQRLNIMKFLKSLNEKNYAQAHKYLKAVMEHKLMSKIAKNKQTKIF